MPLTEPGSSLHCCCLVASGGVQSRAGVQITRQVSVDAAFDPKFRMQAAITYHPGWAWLLYMRGKAGVQELISSLEPFLPCYYSTILVLVRNILLECTMVVRGERSANTTLIRSFKLGSSAIQF